jgi:histidine triad (HIT) family protein
MDCIFCDIVNRKEQAEILFENERVLAFLDIRPVNYGHTLVIPKKHFNNFLDLPQDYLQELISVTQMLSSAIKDGLKSDGFNVIINNGAAAGQTVYHFHFHIIPRFSHDFNYRPGFKIYADGSMQDFAEQIRNAATIKVNKNG